MPVIGFLGGADPVGYKVNLDALRLGLREHGYVEGQTIAIGYRWAEGNYNRLPDLAAELVRRKVAVIITQGTPAAFAAKRATNTIPIVMAIVGNPVDTGLVSSQARPGGNITGSSFFMAEVNAKRLELLKELMPSLARAGVLLNQRKGCKSYWVEPPTRASAARRQGDRMKQWISIPLVRLLLREQCHNGTRTGAGSNVGFGSKSVIAANALGVR